MVSSKRKTPPNKKSEGEKFVYTIYIRATPQKVWRALTQPPFTRQYWYGMVQKSTWKSGASWHMETSDKVMTDSGTILKSEPNKRLALEWRHELHSALKAEGNSRMTYNIAKMGAAVQLTVTHEMPKQGTKFLKAVSGGWPQILSSLKTLLETGKALEDVPGH